MKNSFTGIGFKSVFAGGHTLVPASGEPVNLLCKLHSYRYLSLPPNQAPWGGVRENGNTSGVTMHPSVARVFEEHVVRSGTYTNRTTCYINIAGTINGYNRLLVSVMTRSIISLHPLLVAIGVILDRDIIPAMKERG